MHDNFKKLIDENAKAFEYSFDAEKGWKDFESRQPKKKSRHVWMIAASVSFLALMGAGWLYYPTSEAPKLSEWQEAELFYQAQIDNMTVMVASISDDKQILYDLEEMDLAFAELKNDLKDNANNAEVIEAMMNHYRLKLRILERMLDEIQEENGSEEEGISHM